LNNPEHLPTKLALQPDKRAMGAMKGCGWWMKRTMGAWLSIRKTCAPARQAGDGGVENMRMADEKDDGGHGFLAGKLSLQPGKRAVGAVKECGWWIRRAMGGGKKCGS